MVGTGIQLSISEDAKRIQAEGMKRSQVMALNPEPEEPESWYELFKPKIKLTNPTEETLFEMWHDDTFAVWTSIVGICQILAGSGILSGQMHACYLAALIVWV